MCLAFVLYPNFLEAAELRLFAITVNQTATGVVAPVLTVDDELYLTPEVFARLRIRLPDVPAVRHQGGRYYPLDAHPGAAYELAEQVQEIHLTVPPEYMLPTVIRRGGTGDYVEPNESGRGGFLNYDLLSEHAAGRHELGGLFELGAFAGPFVATGTQVVRGLDEDPDYVRLDSSISRDFPERRLTIRGGDSISRGGAWGRPVRFGGLQVGSNFATQPQFVTFPTIDLSGDAALPSTVDVLINDSQRFSDELPSGPFAISDLPAVTGAGEVTAVVTDVLGRETVITQPYYISPVLLRAGLEDFSYETGFLRENFGLESNDYEDRPFFSGTYRYGLTDRLTGEVHGEFEGERQALGLGAAVPLGHFGVVNGAAAGSVEDAEPGGLVQLGFRRVARDFSFSAFGRLTGGDYTDLGVDDTLRSPDGEARLNLGIPLGAWGTVGSGYSYRAFDGGPDDHVASANYSLRLADFASLNLTGLAIFGSNDQLLASVGLVIPLGPRSLASTRLQVAEDHKPLKTFQASASPPLEGGFGTAIEVSDDSFTRARVELSHTSRYGRFAATGSKVDEQDAARLGAVGSVALADGELFLSRRISNSFAVVSVPEQEGVRVYSENRLIGQTDSGGRLLLHNLRPYDANHIAIEPRDLPLSAEVESVKATVVPRARSGLTVVFPVDDAAPAVLSIRLPDGTPVPPGAAATIDGDDGTALVGLEGEVLLRGLDMGDRVSVEFAGQRCHFVIDREIPDVPVADLGSFSCGGGGS
jgi:outer membrane usher protein